MIDLREDGFDGDTIYTLVELQRIFQQLTDKYGKEAKVVFDAGANNVTAYLIKV